MPLLWANEQTCAQSGWREQVDLDRGAGAGLGCEGQRLGLADCALPLGGR